MSWGVIFSEFNREASLFNAIICPVLILLPNLNLRLLPLSMCVPPRLSSLGRLEIPESIRENAMWLIRVSRVGRLGAQCPECFCNTVETFCENGLSLECETQIAIMDANVLPCS